MKVEMPVSRRSGFTLIELLAVMGVIAVVIAFAIPAANQIIRGSQLTQGSQQLADQMGLARQLALSKNSSIEVRFYRFGDPETPGEQFDNPETGKWRAFQLFEILENGAALPIGPVQRLPRMVVMDGDRYSTLLRETMRGPYRTALVDPTAPEMPIEVGERKVERNYEWVSFRFLPDGSTDLPPRARETEGAANSNSDDSWYVTLIGLQDENKDVQKINFYTVQVDPVSGTSKAYRPNAS